MSIYFLRTSEDLTGGTGPILELASIEIFHIISIVPRTNEFQNMGTLLLWINVCTGGVHGVDCFGVLISSTVLEGDFEDEKYGTRGAYTATA
jgi:hypothetical protein